MDQKLSPYIRSFRKGLIHFHELVQGLLETCSLDSSEYLSKSVVLLTEHELRILVEYYDDFFSENNYEPEPEIFLGPIDKLDQMREQAKLDRKPRYLRFHNALKEELKRRG